MAEKVELVIVLLPGVEQLGEQPVCLLSVDLVLPELLVKTVHSLIISAKVAVVAPVE
jgi:hypothetical protein